MVALSGDTGDVSYVNIETSQMRWLFCSLMLNEHFDIPLVYHNQGRKNINTVFIVLSQQIYCIFPCPKMNNLNYCFQIVDQKTIVVQN